MRRHSKAPFTRYNLLSNPLSNRIDNRFDKRLYRVYSRLSNRVLTTVLKEHPFVQHGCQTVKPGLTTGLKTGWTFVYTIQPVVKPV